MHLDINIEKLADTRGTFWVGTHGSESLHIYTAMDTFKDKETLRLAFEKEATVSPLKLD